MGALHAGHDSLIRQSILACDDTFVSIFVNPTQFGAGEDLEAYPRPIEDDLERCRRLGVTGVFLPTSDQMYPTGMTTIVSPPAVALPLEGERRPGHFAGVCTVVLKLFGILPTDRAFFGKKDYQQLAVLLAMANDLNVPIEIIGCEIVRALDSLALSSRNVYLTTDQRARALAIPQTLNTVATRWRSGKRDIGELETYMQQQLAQTELQYATIRDAATLQIPIANQKSVALIATKVGDTRLIDNVELFP